LPWGIPSVQPPEVGRGFSYVPPVGVSGIVFCLLNTLLLKGPLTPDSPLGPLYPGILPQVIQTGVDQLP
jgi:hypothetical protein